MAELKKLGRYELRRVLGKGAMGVVYEGFDPSLGRQVAVKTILQSAALDEETERAYAERFVREAKAVARLNHPNIIQVYDFGVENEVAYLVMEFIRGRELRSFFLDGHAFAAADAVRIMGELLDALDFAHEAGVIHRDVKPANVMLDLQNRVKLADFGVARVQDSDRSMAGTMVGTPAFMSPEQISGQKIDRRTDIFSAGVILYQLLTGEQPFKGEGAWTVAKKIMESDPPHPSSLVRSVASAFDAIVARALAKKPAERFANARQFAAALRATQGAAATAIPIAPPSAAAPAPIPIADRNVSESELEFWRSIQNSADPHEFEFYLEQFPGGTYAPLARHKIAKLRERPAAVPAAAPGPRDRTGDTTVAVRETPALASTKRPLVVPAGIAVTVIAAGVGLYLVAGRAPAPAPVPAPPVVETPKAVPAPVKPEITAADIDKIRKETEERIRREYADKSAAEQAAAAKAATEKAVAEKQAALKAAADKAAQEKAAADKGVAEKAMAARGAAEKIAADKLTAEKVAMEKAAAEKLAMEKAAADKLASEKVALEKVMPARAVAAAKPGWPNVGDRWVYDARDVDRAERRYQIAVTVADVAASGIRDVTRIDSATVEWTHQASPVLVGVGPGVASFVPYLRAFQELHDGEKLPDVDMQQMWNCHTRLQCVPSARIAGRERVTVRAGSFDAWKIVVDFVIRGGALGSERGQFIYWYAEEARRTVKFQSRVSAIYWAQPNIDMELVSYVPGKGVPEKTVPTAAPSKSGAALAQFIERHGRSKVVERDPPMGQMQTLEVVYVNDGSCPDGEIKELIGGSNIRGTERRARCIKLTQ